MEYAKATVTARGRPSGIAATKIVTPSKKAFRNSFKQSYDRKVI